MAELYGRVDGVPSTDAKQVVVDPVEGVIARERVRVGVKTQEALEVGGNDDVATLEEDARATSDESEEAVYA